MINCIIIEDQPLAQFILQEYISEVDNLCLKGTFADTNKAKTFMSAEYIDLIFLDIHLPQTSGIEFLRSLPNHPKTIFTTAYPEYALESYEFNVIDYLLKPFSYERFLQAISKLESVVNTQEINGFSKAVIIKSNHEHIKVNTSDIVYIASDSHYTEIYTFQKTYLSKDSLKQWLKKLDPKYFCQVHKSYLINIKYLNKVSGNIIHLKNTSIPLGRVYKKYFVKYYLK